MVRPRVLIDINNPRCNSFSRVSRRVSLVRPVRVVRFPAKTGMRLLAFGLAAYLVLGSVFAPGVATHSLAVAQTNGESDVERARLEKQLSDLESQIAAQEGVITKLKKEGKTLQSEIDRLNANVSKLNLQLKQTNLSLTKLNSDISKNQTEIQMTEKRLVFNKSVLSSALQQTYEDSGTGLVEILLLNPRLSDFFGAVNQLNEVQGSLSIAIERVNDLKVQLVNEKEDLAIKKGDAEMIKSEQEAQKNAIQSTKKEKGNLLSVTKGSELKYQQLLKEIKKTAAQIRSRIFELLGGGELSFDDAYKLAKFAGDATGVRPAFILAVLDRESALGQNVGKCSYKTAMHPTRDIPTFLTLTAALNINPESIMVSCPNSDGAYGGAMGPAQFIPSTWNLYTVKIAEVTGSNPPSPWRNGDAFVAAGLYLKDAGAAKNERNAAAKYYCGARWNRYVCTGVYGRKVVEQADRFQQDIDVLNS